MLTLWRDNRWLWRVVYWVLIPIAAIYLWWQWMYPVAQFRYRLTVEVMTPDGLKSGSSVIEVRYSSGHPLPNPGRAYNDRVVAGEAVYVDLGRGKNLFMLLGTMAQGRGYRGNWNYTNTGVGVYDGPGKGAVGVLGLPELAFTFGRSPGEEWKIWRRFKEAGNTASIPPDNWTRLPTFATFLDPRQPNSIRIVQPDELEDAIGTGFYLERVLLQVTDEPVTDKISELLPWLAAKRLPGGRMQINGGPFIDYLGYASFKMPP